MNTNKQADANVSFDDLKHLFSKQANEHRFFSYDECQFNAEFPYLINKGWHLVPRGNSYLMTSIDVYIWRKYIKTNRRRDVLVVDYHCPTRFVKRNEILSTMGFELDKKQGQLVQKMKQGKQYEVLLVAIKNTNAPNDAPSWIWTKYRKLDCEIFMLSEIIELIEQDKKLLQTRNM